MVIWYSYDSSNLLAKLLKHGCSWHLLNAAYVWGLPPGMAPAFAILASNDAAAKVASKNSAAAGVQLFQPLGYCHTAIYTRIYIQDPCLDRFYAQSQGKLSFLKAGVYLESKSKKWRVGEIFEYAVCCTTIYRTIIPMRIHLTLFLEALSSTSLLPTKDVLLHIGLIRIEPICRLLRQQCKFVAWICLGQIVGGQNRKNIRRILVRFELDSQKLEVSNDEALIFLIGPLAQFPGKLQLNLTCIWMSDHTYSLIKHYFLCSPRSNCFNWFLKWPSCLVRLVVHIGRW